MAITVKVDTNSLASIPNSQKKLREIERAIRSRSFLTQIAKLERDIICKRVKSGYGVTGETGNVGREKLKALSTKYVKRREKVGVKGEFGSPRRSNLTFTGQLLKSIRFSISGATISLEIPPTQRSEGTSTNAEVADYVSKAGREFFALTQGEQRIVVRKIKDLLLPIVRRILSR